MIIKHCEILKSYNIIGTKCFQMQSDTNALHSKYRYLRVNFTPKLK